MITGMRSARRPERVSALGAYTDDGTTDGLTKGSGYTIFSYLIAGMLAYGGIGWLIGHFTRISLLFPIGMLVGLYSIRLFALSLSSVMKVPRDKIAAATLLTSIAALLIALIVSSILTRVFIA